jgi:hypothetical protein
MRDSLPGYFCVGLVVLGAMVTIQEKGFKFKRFYIHIGYLTYRPNLVIPSYRLGGELEFKARRNGTFMVIALSGLSCLV